MKNNTIIGKNIKAYREKLQLSQKQLADWLGVSREMISYYESGKREIDLRKLESLAELFGIELINILEEDSYLVSSDLAFAFRSGEIADEDLKQISHFRRIIKNYLKMKQLYTQ
jgi:transcriptional regulator with XRE-family HTH domain